MGPPLEGGRAQGAVTARSDAVVATTKGSIQGASEQGVFVFRGVPFAAPPVGADRFRPPRPPDLWTGIRPAIEFGSAAPQLPSALEQIVGSRELETSEDCLYLNVWTPGLDDARRPVMVWIHGGAFVTGAGSIPWYDGTSFASRGDVVVVTINYRIGVLGFAALDGVVEGLEGCVNLGLLDQVAALEWVRDNIASFGGDPEQVTLFGESAGAMSVGVLMGTPAASGLFSRAILQSGAAEHVADRTQAEDVTREFLGALGVDDLSAETLQMIPVQTILRAQAHTMMRFWGRVHGLPLQPVLDGTVLPRHPYDEIATGSTRGMEVLVGTTRDEMRLFGLMDASLDSLTEDDLMERAVDALGSEADASGALDIYRAARPDATPGQLWAAIQTDRVFRAPATRVAEVHDGETFVYLFTHCTPILEGRLGSCHALEIPFVFNTLDQPGVHRMTGDATPEMSALALAMHDAWINFARDGRPRASGLPEWPAYDTDRRATMLLDSDPAVVDDPFGDERGLWRSHRIEARR
jgi:para-nitrobenzyl esterase